MQKLQVIGNVGTAAIARTTSQGMFLSFSVAVNERWTDKDGNKQEFTTWYNCTHNVKSDVLAQYLTPGVMVFIEGRLRPKIYTNPANGTQTIDMAMSVREIQLLAGKKENSESAPAPARTAAPAPAPVRQNQAEPEPAFAGGSENDLPF